MEDSLGAHHRRSRWSSKEDRRLEDKSLLADRELITLFVDNIPIKANLSWLIKNFKDYGIVKGAFIPAKRSSRNTKFGFVWSDCSAAAGVAIFRANGKMVDNYKQTVKYATFSRNSLHKQPTSYG